MIVQGQLWSRCTYFSKKVLLIDALYLPRGVENFVFGKNSGRDDDEMETTTTTRESVQRHFQGAFLGRDVPDQP